MARKGITREDILNKALEMVSEKGYGRFSLRDLAQALDIKAPSLYNHFSGIDEINVELSLRISEEINAYLTSAIKGKDRDAAVLALGEAYRHYADKEPERFRVLLSLPGSNTLEVQQAAASTINPIMSILYTYRLSESDVIHLHRMFRSLIHGYISLQQAGYLSHREITTEESYTASLNYFLMILHQLEVQETEGASQL